MLGKAGQLIEALNRNAIDYCHWKSNLDLERALAGKTDIDLLVRRRDATQFRMLLAQLCFKLALSTEGEAYPSVENFLALDEETGALLHVHVYYRVITGESLAKNYRFPLETMLLDNTRDVDGVRVPTKGAELVIFTLRVMLKHTSLVELGMLAREWRQIRREAAWLATADAVDEAASLVQRWLPALRPDLFAACVHALEVSAPLAKRIGLGMQLRSQLRPYARAAEWRARLRGLKKATEMLCRRLTRSHKGLNPASGGAVIALVGPEATGKSTLLHEASIWLGDYFAIECIHAGKPRSTLLTVIPNLVAPALRFLLPGHRPSHLERQRASIAQEEQPEPVYSVLSAIRSVSLAHDRHSLLARAFREAANGKLILCDRYPSRRRGAPDSPQLQRAGFPSGRLHVSQWLAQLEERFYREIPAPDLVISLSVPVEVAVLRNASRGKKEPESYVRLRHAQSRDLIFGCAPICQIDTDRSIEAVLLDAKKAIWSVI